jgi:hypothetical protein
LVEYFKFAEGRQLLKCDVILLKLVILKEIATDIETGLTLLYRI